MKELISVNLGEGFEWSINPDLASAVLINRATKLEKKIIRSLEPKYPLVLPTKETEAEFQDLIERYRTAILEANFIGAYFFEEPDTLMKNDTSNYE